MRTVVLVLERMTRVEALMEQVARGLGIDVNAAR